MEAQEKVMEVGKKSDVNSMAPLIAIIGCDGSGKSTVSEEILRWIQGYGPAASVHLGKQAGNIGRALARLPVIGKPLDKLINQQVKKTKSVRKKNKTPSILVATVIYLFSIRRLLRFRRMLALRREGLIIVTDRFPQLELLGAYDGPGLSAKAEGNVIVRWLAKREHAMYVWMTSFHPDLVLRLNVDLDTACARKPDHQRELLRAKIEATPLLKFNGARIAEIDSTQALPEVLRSAKAAVDAVMQARGYVYTAQK